jgi:lytic murein transglycosylase
MRKNMTFICLAFLLVGLGSSGAMGTTTCRDPASFDTWLAGIKKEAAQQGISEAAIQSGLDGVTYDANVVSHDHGQRVFTQTFEQFSARMVNAYRLRKGDTMLKQYAGTFSRIEAQYGVPGAIIVAIWGLETDFGADSGKFETLRALATLAFDCRRSDMFKAELFEALRIVERGDLTPATMHGAWAGELGQTQFMPSAYMKFAVDFDGKGHRDLIHSVPDVLASTANYLKSYGWKKGEPWSPGSPNFEVIQQWNKAEVYSRTIAYFANRLDGKE